jgi:hypothetical protein
MTVRRRGLRGGEILERFAWIGFDGLRALGPVRGADFAVLVLFQGSGSEGERDGPG